MFRDDSSSELAKPFSFSIKVVVICFRGLAHISLFRSLHELTVNSPWEGYEEKKREEAIGKRKAKNSVCTKELQHPLTSAKKKICLELEIVSNKITSNGLDIR